MVFNTPRIETESPQAGRGLEVDSRKRRLKKTENVQDRLE
jgi:hypothetical protein